MAEEVKVPHVVDDVRSAQNFSKLESSINKVRDGLQTSYEELEESLDNYLKKDGSTPLTASWDAGAFTITAKKMKCTESINVLEQASAPASTADTGKIYALSSDSQLYYKDDGGGITQLAGKSGTMVVTSNVTNSTVTPVNVTGLSFNALASQRYGFSFWLRAGSGAATCAIDIQFTGPTSPTGFHFTMSQYENVTKGTITDTFFESQLISALNTLSNFSNWRNDFILIYGAINNGTNSGTVQMQVASEVGGTTVTIYSGSWGTWWLL